MLCDHSPDPELNIANMMSLKDVILGMKQRDVAVPSIYHLTINDETDKILMKYAGDFFAPMIENGMGGKGKNLITSSLATGLYPHDEVALLLFDSDNLKVSARQVFALGAPMYHMNLSGDNFECVISDNDRYHMEIIDGKIKKMLGSRVDNSAIVPLNNTLHEKGLLRDKYNKYCTGERAYTRDLFFRLEHAQQYGFEQAPNLQLLMQESDVNFNSETGLFEVYLGQNQDDAVGQGKKKEEVLYDLGKMTTQIIETTKAFIEKDSFYNESTWMNPEDFMKDFKYQQDDHADDWAFDLGISRKDYVTGGIKLGEILDFSSLVVEYNLRELYESGSGDRIMQKIKEKYRVDISDYSNYSDEILYPIDEIRKADEARFEKMIRRMTNQRVTIHD